MLYEIRRDSLQANLLFIRFEISIRCYRILQGNKISFIINNTRRRHSREFSQIYENVKMESLWVDFRRT